MDLQLMLAGYRSSASRQFKHHQRINVDCEIHTSLRCIYRKTLHVWIKCKWSHPNLRARFIHLSYCCIVGSGGYRKIDCFKYLKNNWYGLRRVFVIECMLFNFYVYKLFNTNFNLGLIHQIEIWYLLL